MHFKPLLLCFSFLLPALSVSAQVLDLEKDRVEVAPLNCLWRFSTGDVSSWADPAFDDTRWPLLHADRSYFDQGYKGYSGFSWYRIRVDLPAKPGHLALYVPEVGDSYQVFANGQLIGEVGGMPPHEKVVTAKRNLFPIPESGAVAGHPLVVAIRVWRWPWLAARSGGGISGTPLIGDADVLAGWQTLQTHAVFWEESDTILGFFANLLTALAGLALFVLRPAEREYLWFGAAQILWTTQAFINLLLAAGPIASIPSGVAIFAVMAGAQLFNLEFFVTLLNQRKRFLYWTAFASIAVSILLLFPLTRGWISDAQWSSLRTSLELVYGICVPIMLYAGARRGHFEARVLLVPFTLSFLCNALAPLLSIPELAGRPWLQAFSRHFWQLFTWPLPMSACDLAGYVALFSVVAVLVLRFARSRSDEERLAAELEAARTVQHVLIPDEIPAVPGFQIECVYKPAGDVGGDFFQILPLSEGGVLLVIGDVSGKGMPAAMTVSLMVGMVRMLIRSMRSPAEILTAINQNIIGRTAGGFTTCLILHIARNGVLTAANAGHVAPYMNGREVSVENGLPLGLDIAATYSETILQLAPEDQVTLLTDGVVEARAADGELFGFERAASISDHPAAEIAAAAEHFGQADDITVLSVTREAIGKGSFEVFDPSALLHAGA